MRAREKNAPPVLKVKEIDLRPISRNSDRCVTRVTIFDDWHMEQFPWLVLGAAQMQKFERLHAWSLNAHLKDGATDFEHDTGYALKLPLVGVEFEGMHFDHYVTFSAHIAPFALEDFHVPHGPDYNPMKLSDAYKCKECKGKDAHIIIPEGFYVPPTSKELYENVRGRRVRIDIATVRTDED